MIEIPLYRLMEYHNPFDSPSPWHSLGDTNQKLSVEVIAEAIRRRQFISSPTYGTTFAERINRIAYFVEFGWTDPIALRLNCGACRILDGNHRFAAAIYRCDEIISVDLTGDVEYCFALFGVD
jgi:hypothetical protein